MRKKYQKIPKRRFMIGILPFLLSASLVYLMAQSQSTIAKIMDIEVTADYTGYIMMIEGDMVRYFQSFANPFLTYSLGFVYLIIFSFIMVFTFVILTYTRDVRTMEEFTIAFIIIYLIAFPFYIFMPVSVTGYTLPDIKPLLYDLSPIIERGVRIVDPNLDNCFPSLHAALSVMAMLIVLFRTNLTRYKIFITASTTAILFSILYLGIHWIADLVSGIILAALSVYLAVRYRTSILKIPHKIIVAVEKKAGIIDNILCLNCSSQLSVVPHCSSVNCPYCGATFDFHPLING